MGDSRLLIPYLPTPRRFQITPPQSSGFKVLPSTPEPSDKHSHPLPAGFWVTLSSNTATAPPGPFCQNNSYPLPTTPFQFNCSLARTTLFQPTTQHNLGRPSTTKTTITTTTTLR
ncbi:hypothetical protein LY76DRAFT_27617 [Colletotrichum caudatum]|nr:hypothetical protein LY76DRAFT_27617 [Colletotrichum caudatum]